MTLTFVTNFVNHHQLPLADEFYRLLGADYHYIATEDLPDWLINGGYDPNLVRPYIKKMNNNDDYEECQKLIYNSDVVIIGAAPIELVKKRNRENKLTFLYTERWFKRLTYHIFGPKTLKVVYENYFKFRKKNFYALCASAFASNDLKFYRIFPNKCYKWGYFTKVDISNSDCFENAITPIDGVYSFMWCARFIDWKHPEIPIELARRLKKRGLKFRINMYGGGVLFDDIKKLVSDLDLADVVFFKGNLPNEKILNEMKYHHFFLFTSDRNEGWGAVANEAMSNGCVLIGSDKIGAVPYLVKDGVNGIIFKSKDIDSLEACVSQLFNNEDVRLKMRDNALATMNEVWSPKNAASNFLLLVKMITDKNLNISLFNNGPCSPA